MEQTVVKSKSWILPFWFMVGVAIFCFLENLFVFRTIYHIQYLMEWRILLFALIWPAVAFIDAIIYWLIRKRIGNRKLIWAHMLFSLFALVLLWVVYFLVFLIIDSFNSGKGFGSYLQKMQ